MGVRQAGEGQKQITALLRTVTEATTSALIEEEVPFQGI
jgi:hypothetical protein